MSCGAAKPKKRSAAAAVTLTPQTPQTKHKLIKRSTAIDHRSYLSILRGVPGSQRHIACASTSGSTGLGCQVDIQMPNKTLK